MQAQMNIKIKFREGFRPFAPSVLRERVADYFELDSDSPYMLLVAPVKKARQIPMSAEQPAFAAPDKWGGPRRVTVIEFAGCRIAVSPDFLAGVGRQAAEAVTR